MKIVTGYEDNGGFIHKTKEACLDSNKKIKMRKFIREAFPLKNYTHPGMSLGYDREEIARILHKERDKLLEVLKDT